MEEMKISKFLLLLFSPSLIPLISPTCSIPTTLFLPDCSTSSIQYFISIINTGCVFTSNGDLNLAKIRETAQLLSIDIKDLKYGDSMNTKRQRHVEDGAEFERSKVHLPTEPNNEEQQESMIYTSHNIFGSFDNSTDTDEEKYKPSDATKLSLIHI